MTKDTISAHLACKIKEFRKARNWTQLSLARSLGVADNTISRWESGIYRPKLEELYSLSEVFDKPVWAFLPGSSEPPEEVHKELLRSVEDLPEEAVREMILYASFIRKRWAGGGLS